MNERYVSPAPGGRRVGWAAHRPPGAPIALLAALVAVLASCPMRAADTDVPPPVSQGLQDIFNGDPDAALDIARTIERKRPRDPLGYLLEGEARWWKLYCASSEIRWGMIDAWQIPKRPQDKPYLDAAGKAIQFAENRLKKENDAQDHLYAGMGYALEARFFGLRGESRATARAGVRGRNHFLKARELDPQLGDAETGLGLYNYYVDTLAPMVKVLRFFLGIPGGNKQEGIRQLTMAMEQGRLTAVEARFYLAKNLRTYDFQYAQAEALIEPLVREYPANPVFLLLLGNLELELGQRDRAKIDLGRVQQMIIPDASCARRSRQLAWQLLASPTK